MEKKKQKKTFAIIIIIIQEWARGGAPLGVGSCINKYTVVCLFQSARSASLPKRINKQTNKQEDYVRSLPDMERPPQGGRRVH